MTAKLMTQETRDQLILGIAGALLLVTTELNELRRDEHGEPNPTVQWTHDGLLEFYRKGYAEVYGDQSEPEC